MAKRNDRFFQKPRMEGRAWLDGILLGIASFFAATALGLLVLSLTDQPFLRDVVALNLPEQANLPADVIIRNYRAVIDFLSPFSNAPFQLPDLAWSESGAFHFGEVKVLFLAFYIAGIIGFFTQLFFLFRAMRRRLYRGTFLISAGATIAFPAVFLAASMINFEKTFYLFHRVFFNNDDWLFDPKTDPVINIMPEEFFLHAALFIAAFWVIAAALQCILHLVLARRSN